MCTDTPDSFAFNSLNSTESFNLTPHLPGPTHIRGNTVVLIFTFGLNIDNVQTKELCVTDHVCIVFNISSDTAIKFSTLFSSSVVLPGHGDVNSLVN